MELNYGILSTSSIAPRFIAAVREVNAGNIVAVSSRTLEKARQKAAQWQIPKAYGSHEELLQDKDVNIVYISNVNTQHYPWAKAALGAGEARDLRKALHHHRRAHPGTLPACPGKGPVLYGSGENAVSAGDPRSP